MANTPAQVDEGMAAVAGGSTATDAHLERVRVILSATGRVEVVPERYLDAVTAISGSGPAYLFFVVEAMIEAGVHLGLPRDLSTELVVQTMLGSAKLLRESGEHPTVLRERVTSPGGTTAAALRELGGPQGPGRVPVRDGGGARPQPLARRRRPRAAGRRMTSTVGTATETVGTTAGRRRRVGRPTRPRLLRRAHRLRLRLRPRDGARPGPGRRRAGGQPRRPRPARGRPAAARRRRAARHGPHGRVHRGRPALPARRTLRPRHERQPGVPGDARGLLPGRHGDGGGGPAGLGGPHAARQQRRRRPAPRHARPDERLLRLQRRRRRDPVAAGPRGRAGRVRRRRRPPRRRRPDGLLRRPAGHDGEPPRDAGVPVPGHGLPDRDRRTERARHGRQRGPAARAPATPAGCARSTRSSRRSSPRTARRCS